MPRGRYTIATGMSIQDHEVLAHTLGHVQEELGQMREKVRIAFGSPAASYVHLTQAMRLLKNLTHTLRLELFNEHGDGKPAPALIKIYREEG